VYVSDLHTLDEVFEDRERVGQLLGQDDAPGRVAAPRQRAAVAQKRATRHAESPSLVVVWHDPSTVAEQGTHVHDLLRLAGGRNLVDSPGYPAYSLERALSQAPTTVLHGQHAAGDGAASEALPAALRRLCSDPVDCRTRMRSVDGDLLFRPGPRLVDGLERLVAILDGGPP
jgi:iron complex transport system substrate-binding protein